jgi:hypothetical protein
LEDRLKKGEPLQGKDYDLAPGMIFSKEYNGEKHTIKVLDDGKKIEYRGKVYKTISGVASEIRGYREDGYRFFNVNRR